MSIDKTHDVRTQLNRYIHTRSLNRRDLIVSVFLPQFILNRNAKTIIDSFRTLHREGRKIANKQLHELAVEPYAGQNRYVRKLMYYLDRHLKDDLYGAYLHGSLGTYEEIPYSDFDALVILKNEVFESVERLATVANKLRGATSIMYEFDPLQHHGWFVLTQADLERYPETYFPHELFRHSKALLPGQGRKLSLHLKDDKSDNLAQPFWNLSNYVITRLSQHDYPKNAYQLKGLLSQFMLLPTLYVQGRDGKGIYKKFSFARARKDFSSWQWATMDEVSEIRAGWHVDIHHLRRILLSSGHLLSSRYAKKFGATIPVKVKERLTPDFYQRMHHLVVMMQEKLKKIAPSESTKQFCLENAS